MLLHWTVRSATAVEGLGACSLSWVPFPSVVLLGKQNAGTAQCAREDDITYVSRTK